MSADVAKQRSPRLRRVLVDDLRVGMYVSELDRPWLETDFPLQGLPIRSNADIESLRRQCRAVYVDPARDAGGPDRRPVAVRPASHQEAAYVDALPVEHEIPRAKKAYADCEDTMWSSLRELNTGGGLDGKRLSRAVSAVSDSIVRNADAMLLLTRLQQKGDYEMRRALDTSIMMITFARFLQLSREQLDLLGLVGLLQDVGKVVVPDEVLRKAEPLSSVEQTIVRSHVTHSAHLLGSVDGLPTDLPELVLLHHERQDGSGYPRGLKGPEIGMLGSIAAILDCFSALTSERGYAEQLSPSNALGMIYKGRDIAFHGALVEQFIQCIGIYPVGSIVEMNTGEIGVVIAQNRARRLQPRVMLVLDRERQPIQPQIVLDLLKDPMATPEDPYRIRRTVESGSLPLNPRDFFL